jgi:hypothetical protein
MVILGFNFNKRAFFYLKALLFYFLFTSFNLAAFTKIKGKNGLFNYYNLINDAELNIIDSNLTAAKLIYKEAFKIKEPFGKDLYNAFLVSYYSNDTFEAKKYVNMLAFKGFNKFDFCDTIENKEYYNFVFSKFDYYYSKGFKLVDKSLIKFWDSVLFRDQLYRNNNFIGVNYDSVNNKEIKNYIKRTKPLSSVSLGFWTKNSSPYIENFPLFIHLWHVKRQEPISELENIYLNYCNKGILPIFDLTAIYLGKAENSWNDSLANMLFLKIWDLNKIKSDEIKKIDIVREKYYLNRLYDYYKKYFYQQNHQIRFGITERNMYVFLNPFQVNDENIQKLLFPNK